MIDRKLIEAAATAAGYEYTVHHLGRDDYAISIGGYEWWNPLSDDGEALRLAVKLGISTEQDKNIEIDNFTFCGVTQGEYEVGVEAWHVKTGGVIVAAKELYGDDKPAATRCAIVRAAAAMAVGEA